MLFKINLKEVAEAKLPEVTDEFAKLFQVDTVEALKNEVKGNMERELEFNLKVIIAAHPKSKYSKDVFGGREIYYDRTPELSINSKFIIAHHSTAISYAVLGYKPIIFIYTDEIKFHYKFSIYKYIENFSCFLESKLINISQTINP